MVYKREDAMNWWLILLTFIGVNLDFFFILLFLLKKYRLTRVMAGYMMGLWILLLLSFFAGQILDYFFPEWLLGILGVLPIYMAIHDDDEKAKDYKANCPTITVLITYLSVCAGCNLSMFIPVLTTLHLMGMLMVLVVLTIFSDIIILIIKQLVNVAIVKTLMEKYGEQLTKVVYIGVGIYVFFDSGLISHLLSIF